MKRFIAMVWLCVVVLAGCTSASKNVAAVYVPATEYSNYSCRQLLVESDRIKNHYQQLTQRLDALAAKDSVNGAVGVVVFFPLLFGVGGNEALELEYGQYKGELSALLMAATSKKCTNLAWAAAELKKISVME
jgi:hypothetical protein